MKKYFLRKKIFLSFIALTLLSCSEEKKFDAAGNFEAEETIISAQATGRLLNFTVEDGMTLSSNQLVGQIEDVNLRLRKEQVEASIQAVQSKTPNMNEQLRPIEQQIQNLESEKKRIGKLVAEKALPSKQLDDINYQIRTLQAQKTALTSQITTQRSGILAEVAPLEKQIAQISEQINESKIVNPAAGTVLTSYAEPNEFITIGKPLYKIADLGTMILRAYVSGSQLSSIKIGQTVNVFVDKGESAYKNYSGKIIWISDKSEFTPKTIQTKEDRVNLVYAAKISVKNDGFLKIGMPAEVKFSSAK